MGTIFKKGPLQERGLRRLRFIISGKGCNCPLLKGDASWVKRRLPRAAKKEGKEEEEVHLPDHGREGGSEAARHRGVQVEQEEPAFEESRRQQVQPAGLPVLRSHDARSLLGRRRRAVNYFTRF